MFSFLDHNYLWKSAKLKKKTFKKLLSRVNHLSLEVPNIKIGAIILLPKKKRWQKNWTSLENQYIPRNFQNLKTECFKHPCESWNTCHNSLLPHGLFSWTQLNANSFDKVYQQIRCRKVFISLFRKTHTFKSKSQILFSENWHVHC